MRFLFFAALALGAVFWWLRAGQVDAIELPDGSLAYDRYAITPLEDFELEARVLSRQDYRRDRESELAPTDLALGWGPMEDDAVLEEIEISQGNRWYRWRAGRLPIPARTIETHSANMHMIAGNSAVAAALAGVEPTDRIRVSGKLVEVLGEDGWRWRSSLTRNDTGAGSCELLFLERLEVL